MPDCKAAPADFLPGESVMARLIHIHDWSRSPLGGTETWPASLKTILGLMLESRFPMFVAWGDDLVLLYNDAYCEILGEKHPAALGRSLKEVWAEVWPGSAALVDNALAGEASWFRNRPLSVLRKGYKEQAWFTLSHSPARDDEGNIAGLFCACTETTHQVLAENYQAFRLTLGDRIRDMREPDAIKALVTEALEKQLNLAGAGYGEIDASRHTLQILPASSGGLPGGLVACRPLDDFGPEVLAALQAGQVVRIDDIANDARTAAYADRYAIPDTPALLLAPLIREGRLIALLYLRKSRPYHWNPEEEALTADIAERTWEAVGRARAEQERNKAEQALSEQLEAQSRRLHMLFQQAPGFMAVLRGPNHVFELVNEAFYRLTGRHDVLGKTVREVFPEIEGQHFLPLLDRVFQTGEPYFAHEAQIFLQQTPGAPVTERFLDFIYQPVVEADGTVSGIFVEGYDVTDRRRATQALQEADRRKDEFLAMLAHELRNPLAPISSAAQLLKMGHLGEKRVQETSDIIARQVEHITGLVDDLLDVSRVTRGTIKLENKIIDLREVVMGAVEQVRGLIEARHHRFTSEVGNEPVYICGDRTRLIQILANLLQNAAKYTLDGGDIRLGLSKSENDVLIEIRDNGVGIASDLLPRVFDLFTQAMPSPDRSQGGLGLGLALVKRLVELHRGTVTASSAGKGKGSTFIVRLPEFKLKGADLDLNEIREPATAARGLRLMIVDDNTDAAQFLALLLNAEGHQVVVAHDAPSALKNAHNGRLDACLLDIGLSDMDGYELARRLRQEPAMLATSLIALTGYGGADDLQRSREAGFDYHLTKPADMKKLTAILSGVRSAQKEAVGR